MADPRPDAHDRDGQRAPHSLAPQADAEDDPPEVRATPNVSFEVELARIHDLMMEAMESFEFLDFEQARILLDQCITRGIAAGLSKEPLLAEVHLRFGIVYYADGRNSDAVQAFIKALTIAPHIQLPPRYYTAALQQLLDAAKRRMGKPRI